MTHVSSVAQQSRDWHNIFISRWNARPSHIICPVNLDEPETASKCVFESLLGARIFYDYHKSDLEKDISKIHFTIHHDGY